MTDSVLVTGADGFIGRAVVRAFERRGRDVLGVSRRPTSSAPVRLDLRGSLEALPRAEWVVHLAGGYAGASLRALRETDGVITDNLLEWGAVNRVRRWVIASAAEVYGACTTSVDEAASPAPVLPYGAVKLELERRFTRAAAADPDLSVAILRIGEVYGPSGRLLNELSRRFGSGFCPWFGSGNVPVSFVHVDDVAGAIVAAAESGLPAASTWNVCDDEPTTWRAFLDRVATLVRGRPAVGLPLWLSRIYAAASTSWDRLHRREPMVTQRIVTLLTTPKPLSNRRLRERLGWAPAYPDIGVGLAACFERGRVPPGGEPLEITA